nr:sodium/calcium exchanger 3 isoform X3 [Saimiri boliviensis boliviensis]
MIMSDQHTVLVPHSHSSIPSPLGCREGMGANALTGPWCSAASPAAHTSCCCSVHAPKAAFCMWLLSSHLLSPLLSLCYQQPQDLGILSRWDLNALSFSFFHLSGIHLQTALLLSPEVTDRKLTMEEEEAKRVAEMGKPVLGEHSKLEVIIEESYEFKTTVDKLIKKTNLALVVGTHSWRDQFMEAITVSAAGDEDEDESGEERLPSCFDYVMHFLTVFWKVLFACVPPTEYCHGWACFAVSILIIGMLTAIIGDLASHFGCTIGLKDSVTAVVFVAFGTSVPDTFASKAAALQDVYADASIGNVTGSNAVNVFLGIGLAWSVAAIYWALQGQEFHVSAGTLAFSVTLFTIFAFVCISVLLYRRRPHLGGELGGPRGCKLATTWLFVSLWLLYILFATLEAYCYIKGF